MISFHDYYKGRLNEESPAGVHDAQSTRFNQLYQGDNYKKAREAILADPRFANKPIPVSAFIQQTKKDAGLWEWLWRQVFGSLEGGNKS